MVPLDTMLKIPGPPADGGAAIGGVATAVPALSSVPSVPAVAAPLAPTPRPRPKASVPVIGGPAPPKLRSVLAFPAPPGRYPGRDAAPGLAREEARTAVPVASAGALIPSPSVEGGPIAVLAFRRPPTLGAAVTRPEAAVIPTGTARPAPRGRARPRPPRLLPLKRTGVRAVRPIGAVGPRTQVLSLGRGVGTPSETDAIAPRAAAAAALRKTALKPTRHRLTHARVVPELIKDVAPLARPSLRPRKERSSVGVTALLGAARPIAAPGPTRPPAPEVALERMACGAVGVGERARAVDEMRKPFPRVGLPRRHPAALDVTPVPNEVTAVPSRPPSSGRPRARPSRPTGAPLTPAVRAPAPTEVVVGRTSVRTTPLAAHSR